MKNSSPLAETVVAQTQEWLEKAVIGLNMCPFANAVHVKKQIRYVVSSAKTEDALLVDLISSLQNLVNTPAEEIDTAILIHPEVLTDFRNYNQFLDVADRQLIEMNLDGVIQIASFHPQYQFAGTAKDDISNFTNRSPYPLLHFLREESVSRAVDSYADVDSIHEKNIEMLGELGLDGYKKLGIPIF